MMAVGGAPSLNADSSQSTPMDQSDSSILIFGGTFDPPHRAHTILPPLAAQQLGCARVIYIPTSINPLKLATPPTPAEHRLAMLRLAVGDIAAAEINTLELDRTEPSYTVDTLGELRQHLGSPNTLRLLIGSDQALDFKRWKDWRRVLELAAPAVMLRPPYDRALFLAQLRESFDADEIERWDQWIVDLPRMDINATDIRQRLANGEDLDELLPPAVAAYIDTHELYRS